jgi:hypothetical protein
MTNYQLLRQRAEEMIRVARENVELRLAGAVDHEHLRVMSSFSFDAEGLLGHLTTLERFEYPLGDDFEKDPDYNPDSDTYRELTRRIASHVSRLARWQSEESFM